MLCRVDCASRKEVGPDTSRVGNPILLPRTDQAAPKRANPGSVSPQGPLVLNSPEKGNLVTDIFILLGFCLGLGTREVLCGSPENSSAPFFGPPAERVLMKQGSQLMAAKAPEYLPPSR